MKVALLGDVHGNLPALEAVLADADARGCEAVWNIGDFVGYGAFPDEVVRLLRKRAAANLIGNYDQKALEFKKKDAKWRKTKRREKWLAFKFAYEHLSKPSRKWLRTLPEQQRLDVAGRRILLCHGSPASVDEHLWLETPAERYRELAAMADADIVVCGHSHQAFVREAGRVPFINTGTVGRPDDGDPRACYAVLALAAGVDVAHHRVPYDTGRAVAAVHEHGLPEAFAQMLLEGRSLDAVSPP
ncbi:MAG: metallophosphoesterase family protein [Candidatus Brocadiae bacterium]|nr:metallophosphoesterase family protein [Candidatus Brocadiia bacterium]